LIKSLKIQWFCLLAILALTRLGFSYETGLFKKPSLPELIIGAEERHSIEKDHVETTRDTLKLAKERMQNLPEILDAYPIIQLIPSGTLGDPPRFYMRGMDNSQTRFFLEGIPLGEPVFQSNALSLLPTYAIGEIEMFPSVVPTFFLSSGLGGAVNVRIPNLAQPYFLQTEFGSFGFMKGAARAPLFSDSRLAIDYVQSEENFPFLDNNGTPWNAEDDQFKTRENNRFQQLTVLPSWELDLGDGSRATFLSLNGFQNKTIPGSVESPETNQLRVWNHLSALKVLVPLDIHWIFESSAYLRKNKEELLCLRQPLSRISNNSSAGGTFSALLRELSWEAQLSLGFDSSQFVLSESDLDPVEVSQQNLPVSLSTRIALNPEFTIHPAFLGVISKGGTVSSNLTLDPSLRMGLEYAIGPDLKVRGFAGSVFRAPSLSEKFGLQPGVVGNDALQNETALKADLGAVWESRVREQLGIQQLAFTVFGVQAQNLIAYVQNSSNSHRPENISNSIWMGNEISAALTVPGGGSFQPSILGMFSRNQSEVAAEKEKNLPYMAPWRAKLTSRWERGHWFLSHHLVYNSETFTDKANLQKIEATITHDLALGYFDKTWGRVELKVLNLFDRNLARASVMGLDSEQYLGGTSQFPSAGRRINVSWVVDL